MGWKIYFWLMLILLLMAYSMIFLSTPTIWDLVDVIISVTAIAGVFAYAYKRKLLSFKFWQIWLAVIILWDLTYNILLTDYLHVAQQISTEIGEETFAEGLFGWVVIIPEYIALYLLGFKSGALWKQ